MPNFVLFSDYQAVNSFWLKLKDKTREQIVEKREREGADMKEQSIQETADG